MKKKKVLLVTGGSGYLGRHLTARAMDAFSVYAGYYMRPDRIKAGHPVSFDISRRDSVLRRMAELTPQVIIHTAALNPGGSEQEMMQVNGLGARHVAEGAAAVGARLIYVSTDVVYSGQNAPYDDDASPSPINVYGRSKAAGEAAVVQVAPQAAIVRTSLIYGLQEMDRSTTGFAERLRAGRPLVLFNDVIRQPIWVESLVEALLKLSSMDFAGKLNVVGRQALTREEFGRRMLDWWQVNARGLLQSGRAVSISSSIPLDLRMTTAKAEQVLAMTLPGVDRVLGQAEATRL